MRDSTDLVRLMKQAAMEAVKTSQPSNIVFGTVTSASPLKIQISSKITLEKEMLMLTSIIVHNQLKSGEKVVLIKEQGGQRYIVLDRVVSA